MSFTIIELPRKDTYSTLNRYYVAGFGHKEVFVKGDFFENRECHFGMDIIPNDEMDG